MEGVVKVIDILKIMVECGHTQHLTRERALRNFCEKYEELKTEGWEENLLEVVFQSLRLQFSSNEWEHRYGAVQIAVKTLGMTSLSKDSPILNEFKEYLFDRCRILVTDGEFRVRNSIGDIMQKLIIFDGSKVYDSFKDFLFMNIRENFTRDPKGSDASSSLGKFMNLFSCTPMPCLSKNSLI